MQKPDFIGTWSLDFDVPYFNIVGLFSIYITEKQLIEDQKHLIKGYILDCFGYAGFAGEQSPEEITFVKKYSTEAIERGSAPDMVEYHAIKHNGSYSGTYKVVNGRFGGIPCDWEAFFALKECDDDTFTD